MEVFMRNLPRDVSNHGLAIQLDPFMKHLRIVDYSCEKAGKSPYGSITFLHEADGKKFLANHGEETPPAPAPSPGLPRRGWAQGNNQPRARARLLLLGKHVYCKTSKRAADDITLRSLRHKAEGRATHTEAPKNDSSTFELHSLSCGYNTFEGGEMEFVSERTYTQPGRAKFSKRKLVIDLHSSHVQIRIPTSTIVGMVQGADASLIITLSTSPVFLDSQNFWEIDLADRMGGLYLEPVDESWSRVSAIDSKHALSAPYCLVYRIKASSTKFREKMKRIESKGLIPVTRHDVAAQLVPTIGYAVHVKALEEQLGRYLTQADLPFGILFSLKALVYNGYLHPAKVSELARRLCRLRKPGQDFPISVEAMKKLFEWINYPDPFGDALEFEVEYIIETLLTAEDEILKGVSVRSGLSGESPNLTQTYRAVVTPSRITLHGPELTAKNRILRKFPDHQDCFLRVQFTDEGGDDLLFNPKISLDQIYLRFKDVLKRGISIAGRLYMFLGFSHSSLRAHSVWFCAPFVDGGRLHTHFTIIDDLGQLNNIDSPARRAARIGQAFSETPFSVPLKETGIEVFTIPDVKSGDGQRIFSDGVGTISEAAMMDIWERLPSSKQGATCFQIRYAGAKGMLSLDSRLTGRQVRIRESMTKFQGKDVEYLEICDMATQPIPLVLNRQLIKIMEDMGAPDSWFVNLHNKELSRLRGITANPYNTANFLEMQSVGKEMRLSRFLRHVESLGIDYRKDRFLRTVVEAVVLKELRLLKHKARIPVQHGATLFGVMDETNFLGQNEVYISCDEFPLKPDTSPRSILVLVTRSPALHPGDVQVAWATNVPPGHPLTDLRNCIVFSQTGTRDLPSQLSGGDLDGDIYHVVWDQSLGISKLKIFPPADYPRVAPRTLGRPVTKDDMADFFVDFMQTDHLGPIATRHIILADQNTSGTLDPDCIKLARLHSTAVDFSKTGIPVELNELPRVKKCRPDFLAPGPLTRVRDKSEIDLEERIFQSKDPDDEDGPRHEYYKSDKILGKLYRSVDEKKIWYEDIKTVAHDGGPSFWNEFIVSAQDECANFGTVEWSRRREEAERIRHAYNDAIYTAMTDLSDHPVEPLTELEVFVGFIINKTGIQTSRQRDRSNKLRDEFERISSWIVAEMRKPSREADLAADYGLWSDLSALEMCLACVHVGCAEESAPATGRFWSKGAAGLQSFRIVAASALVQEMRRGLSRARARDVHGA